MIAGGRSLFFFEKKVVIYEILLLSLRLNKEQGVGSKEQGARNRSIKLISIVAIVSITTILTIYYQILCYKII